RRQLTEDQRRAVAVELRQQGYSYRAIAGALGVSHEQVRKDVTASGVNELTPEQPDRVKALDGKTYPARRPTVVAAKNEREAERAQQALATLGEDLPSSPVLDVKRVERVAREHQAEQRRAQPVEPATVVGEVEIRHGDFRQILSDIEPGTVDAIITDPPYPGEFIGLFTDLSQLAARLL